MGLRASIRKQSGRFGRFFSGDEGKKRQSPGNDAHLVESAARLLQISDFAFFHLAHEKWFGQIVSDARMEGHFASYLLSGEIPHWVRHLARQITARQSRGPIDPKDFGVDRPPPPQASRAWKVACALLLALMYAIFYLLFSGSLPWREIFLKQ